MEQQTTILLVDDDEIEIMATKRSLRRYGIDDPVRVAVRLPHVTT